MSSFRPSRVHLVGSLPRTKFATVEDVFSKIPAMLRGLLKRIPDGELGVRHYYIKWQRAVFPLRILKPFDGGRPGAEPKPLSSTPSQINPQDIKPLMYDDAAIASYQAFRSARTAGDIPADVRFQVSLPSPMEAPAMFVQEGFQESAAAFYEYRMLETVHRIQEAIPAQDLAIQWDLSVIVALLESKRRQIEIPLFSSWLDNPLDYHIKSLSRVVAAVNQDVEIGFHLCYGDIEHRHFVQPEDLGLLVDMAQALFESIHYKVHAINWIHMPVPRDRADMAYFQPLRALSLPGETQLILGVVHANDRNGTVERIEAAWLAYGKPFSIASECGMGRTTKEDAESVLAICMSICVTNT